MHSTAQHSRHRTATSWAVGGFFSAILLGLVLYQVDWRQAGEMVRELSWRLVLAGVLLYLVEGVVTALRIRLFSPGRPSTLDCLKANAWYVVSLVLLPARLGEVAAVIIFQRYLGMRSGMAVMSIVMQRMLDVAVLSGLFLVASVFVAPVVPAGALYGVAAAVIAAVITGVSLAGRLLGVLAGSLLRRYGRPSQGMRRRLVRLLLQARLWHRRYFDSRMIAGGLGLTLIKWGAHLTGFFLLLAALRLPFGLQEGVLIGAAYNFLAIIPIQTIGGFGVAEAGLAGLLILSGLSLPIAAGVSVLVRVVLIAAPFLFWLLVMAVSLVGKSAQNRSVRQGFRP